MLKSNFYKSRLLLLVIFCLSGFISFASNDSDWNADDEKVKINFKSQTLTFYLTKKNELRAKLIVNQEIESKTNLPYTFSQSVFFDDNTTVTKIQKYKNKKTTKVTPIISDYESDGIFHSDLKVCYFEHKFSKKEEKIVFSYEKIFKDLKFLDPFYFNDSYPIDLSKVTIEKPDWMNIDLRELNFELEKPDYKKSMEKSNEVHTYTMENLPAGFKYNGAPRRSKINAHLILIPNSYTKNGQAIKLIEKVDDLYAWYSSLVDQIGNDNSDLKKIVADLTNGLDSDTEKIKTIFYWVQDNVRYIAFEDGIMGFRPESCQSVFNNKYGDCKGMANLTKEMLMIAGYDARLTWLGTADVPYDYDIPSLLVDNHMICTVILNGEKIFLDPTEKYAELYNYAFRIQNQQALIEDGDGFIIERIPGSEPGKNTESSVHTLSINKEKLEGEGSVTFKGNRKTYIFNFLSANPQNKWEELMRNYITNRDKNVQTKLLTEPSLQNRDDDFELNYDITMEHHIIDLGEELYVNLEPDFTFQKFEIKEERNVPYEFSGFYAIEHTSILNIPEGWKVNYLPPALTKDHKKYSFNFTIDQEGQQIIYKKRIAIKETMLNVEDFDEWNETIKNLNTFYSDQIILNKQ